jgi:hypothetical protein
MVSTKRVCLFSVARSFYTEPARCGRSLPKGVAADLATKNVSDGCAREYKQCTGPRVFEARAHWTNVQLVGHVRGYRIRIRLSDNGDRFQCRTRTLRVGRLACGRHLIEPESAGAMGRRGERDRLLGAGDLPARGRTQRRIPADRPIGSEC